MGVTDPESVARHRLAGDGIDVIAWGNGPGDRYTPHVHDHDKVLVVVSGSIRFLLPALDATVELAVGDRMDLPAGTTHAAVVGPAGVRCLEGHLPRGTLGSDTRRVADWVSAVLAAKGQPVSTTPARTGNAPET
jgi:uncharacterized protein YjlB